MKMVYGAIVALTIVLALGDLRTVAAEQDFNAQVAADWLLQARHRGAQISPVTTKVDACGGCDGIIDGRWGFHTDLTDRPWWQVDLGAVLGLGRAVIWNRTDEMAVRADRLVLLLSDDGMNWRTAHAHDGGTFRGFADNKPLSVDLSGQAARFVRIELPGRDYLHLDEVQVFAPGADGANLALGKPADQVSVSQWSTAGVGPDSVDWAKCAEDSLALGRRLADELGDSGVDVSKRVAAIDGVSHALASGKGEGRYLQARAIQRRLTLSSPLLDFDAILFAKRVPGSFNHMSDQYYGWWSRPGGGLYILRGFKDDAPRVECISGSFGDSGSFLRPTLSYDAKKVLFAWCRHYPELAGEEDKLDKGNVPEDAFYHVFEMNVDGTDVRQLTHGKYDDFDARYLPDGRIVFLSTRRGQFIQCGADTAAQTCAQPDLPDIYVRCGGGAERPVAVYTLHTMNADGSGMCAISPFEMFEWTPSIAHDGTILYSRWDYIDRDNMPYMGLWRTNPDGANASLVYANYTKSPHCTFEPRSIPNSDKVIFTASGHHAQTMGSLVLLDPSMGTEGDAPITRLTPEVAFPEIEDWPRAYFAHPWPLSESLYLVSWGCESSMRQGQQRESNGMGLYVFNAAGGLELLYRDPEISCAWPMPLRERPKPHVVASAVNREGPNEGRFLLADVRKGLKTVGAGEVKALRVVAVPGKTHPTMNFPAMGITNDDPGKCVLGTVPVEADGSAYFRVPAGLIVFFQALDADGMAIQTMRSTTHVQPGQTLSCIGCHESRQLAPPLARPLASMREPSRITPGPEGSWPLSFDKLVQPVLDKHCVRCHSAGGRASAVAKIDLTSGDSYDSLVRWGKPSLYDHVWAAYRDGFSTEGACEARQSPLLAMLTSGKGHRGVKLDKESIERLVVWMDTYAQRNGSFSEDQERRLLELRATSESLLQARSR